MPSPIPLLLAAGAAAVVLGGKKKKRKSKPRTGESCDALEPPVGYSCDEGVLQVEAIDEGDLEKDEEPTGDEAGDFDMKEEDVSLTEGEEAAEVTLTVEEVHEDPAVMCEEFLAAIHVDPTEADEFPINAVATEQTAIPAMRAVMLAISQSLGKPIDAETVGPLMVRQALAELVPACEWKYDEANDEFIYNDGRRIESEIGKEVLYGLMNLSVQLIDDFNQTEEEPPLPNVGLHAVQN